MQNLLQSGKRRFLQKCIFPASSCKNVFAPKMSFLQSQHKYKCGFEEIFACSQFFPQKCFFIVYQASRSPLTCKQVRGGTSLCGAPLQRVLSAAPGGSAPPGLWPGMIIGYPGVCVPSRPHQHLRQAWVPRGHSRLN